MKTSYALLCLVLAVPLYSQQVVINEIMSLNEDVIEDADGMNSDWIELYNPGNEVISLLGYHLSDDDDEPDKWTFPAVEMAPESHLIVFASGKNKETTSELHTNFKIKSSGEPLLLSDANGTLLDLIPSVDLKIDISYGRFPDGSNQFLFFDNPTPKETNKESNYIVSSHESGFYKEPFYLNLQTPNNEHVIRYTLDGTTPTSDSPIFWEPLLIGQLQKIDEGFFSIPTTPLDRPVGYIWKAPTVPISKASIINYQSFQDDEPIGQVQARIFFVDEQVADLYTFPVVSIISDSVNLFGGEKGILVPGKTFEEKGWVNNDPRGNYSLRGPETERPFHFHYFEPNGELAVEIEGGIRIHGSYTRRFPQKSFKTYFRSEYGQNKIEYPMFESSPIEEFKRLHFKSSDFLRTVFRDYFLQNLVENTAIDRQESKFVNLFINGEYWGIYTMQERQDKFYFEYKFDIEEESIIVDACGENDDDQVEPLYEELIEFVEETNWKSCGSFEALAERIEVDNFIDYMITQIFIANLDWPGNNYKMWRSKTPGSKWRWLLYDLDNTYGAGLAQPEYNSILHATSPNSAHWSNPECSTMIFRTVLKNQQFRRRFLDRFSEMLNTTFSTTNLLDRIESTRLELLPEIQAHIDRWNYPENTTAWQDEIEVMKRFSEKRPCLVRTFILDYFRVGINDFGFDDNCKHVPTDTLLASELNLYPNPSSGSFFLEFLPSDFCLKNELEVYNLNGVLIKKSTYVQVAFDKISFDLSDLNTGFYIVRFPIKDGGFNRKVTVFR